MDQARYQDRIRERWTALKSERSSWIDHWREISQHLQPRLGRFLVDDVNEGGKRHTKIYDSTATRALRVLAAGMMAGMTSPARPWFRLATADPELNEHHDVKNWLSDTRRIMLDVFARSNTYRSLQTMYEELGAFGTSASLCLPNYDRVVHHYPSTIGQYAIATDPEGQVNTFYREFNKRVSEMVAEFGYENCSRTVQNCFDRGDLDKWFTVIHAIEPRADRDRTKRDARNMPYKSVYFEQGGEHGRYLRESGFKRFRVLAPRWHVTGGDIYGYSPGMEALGDTKQLQHEQLRKAQGIDYMTKPPLQVPTNMKGREVNQLPGGVNYIDIAGQTGGVRTLFETTLNLDHLLVDIQDVRDRINSAFYADLFLMLAVSAPDGRMTATEVAERHEEKMLMLGPVLERLHDELLSPLVAGTFEDVLEAGIVPPPPPQLARTPLRIEFVSTLAQAQRAVETAGVDRFVANLGAIAPLKPEVIDKFDADKWADRYADALGLDPELIVPTQNAVLIRQQRAEAQRQAEQAAMINQTADTAQKLGNVSTQGGASNAANDIMSLFAGYNSPTAETY